MYQNLKKRTEGFTIIEVLIVLAIAGLIMLIVFLAVPALQRNSRNNGRNSDGARISAAITECLSNRNNQTASCNTDAEIEQGVLSQLTGAVTYGGGSGTTTSANFSFNTICNPDNSGAQVVANGRAFAVLFQLETSGASITRCIGSEG